MFNNIILLFQCCTVTVVKFCLLFSIYKDNVKARCLWKHDDLAVRNINISLRCDVKILRRDYNYTLIILSTVWYENTSRNIDQHCVPSWLYVLNVGQKYSKYTALIGITDVTAQCNECTKANAVIHPRSSSSHAFGSRLRQGRTLMFAWTPVAL